MNVVHRCMGCHKPLEADSDVVEVRWQETRPNTGTLDVQTDTRTAYVHTGHHGAYSTTGRTGKLIDLERRRNPNLNL